VFDICIVISGAYNLYLALFTFMFATINDTKQILSRFFGISVCLIAVVVVVLVVVVLTITSGALQIYLHLSMDHVITFILTLFVYCFIICTRLT